MLEKTLLQVLKYRERYGRLQRAIPVHALEAKAQILFNDFGVFFKEFPDVERIEMGAFFPWFKHMRHPTLTTEQHGLYQILCQGVLLEDCDSAVESGLLERLHAADTASRVAGLLEKWNAGEELDLYQTLRSEVERFETLSNRTVKVPWVTDDIDDILLMDKHDTGLHFRLDCLNTCMRPLRGGDFVVLAGRPDKGKTTIISSEITHMASQFDTVYGVDHGKHVLWFNNEGPGKRIVQRVYQSALNATLTDLLAYSAAGTLKDQYAAMVGALDRIRVMDIHDFHSYEVEDIMKRINPGLVVFDMVDNIKFGGNVNNGGQRTDQLLEAMYQWARVLGVKYDTPCIATSQISADGDGLQFPTLPMLKDSKTGKQGAADAIITLGAVNDQFYANSRFIGLTKNKLRREGSPQTPNCEVTFDGQRGRVIMPPGA